MAEERARREEESRRLEAEQAREREEQLRRQAEERERREREDQERAQKQVGAPGRGGEEVPARAPCVQADAGCRSPAGRRHRPTSYFQKEEEARLREEAEKARQEREKHFQREEQERLERKKVTRASNRSPGCCSHSSPALTPQDQGPGEELTALRRPMNACCPFQIDPPD